MIPVCRVLINIIQTELVDEYQGLSYNLLSYKLDNAEDDGVHQQHHLHKLPVTMPSQYVYNQPLFYYINLLIVILQFQLVISALWMYVN